MLADADYQPTKRGPHKKREGALVTGLRHCFGLSSPACCHSVSTLKRETHALEARKCDEITQGMGGLATVRTRPPLPSNADV